MQLAELHEKASQSAHNSPLTWGALSTAVACIVSCVVSVFAVLAWTDNRYELRDHDPNRPDVLLRQEILGKIADARKVLDDGFRDARRSAAWTTVQLARNSAEAKAARVNDCNILREKRALTPMENGACKQYDEDLKSAQDIFTGAQNDAIRLSR